ncbi:MAG TPA: MFS transporter [Chloroflexaceae bacterium]|nr:MFS transporter [Chloroflexaceae bacterium]
MQWIPRADGLRSLLKPRTVAERNVRNVLVDGIGVGIVTGVGTFLPVFLARLGASSLLVGLLTSLPALTGALMAVPIGRFLERQRNVVPWYSRMRVWVLWSYAVFGLLPFVLPLGAVPWAVIAIWAMVTLPSTVVNVAFTVVMGGVAGPKNRFALMSMRWSSLGAVTAITVALVGQFLVRFPFPLNYQLVFIGSFLGGLLSYLFSRSIVLPDQQPDAPAPNGPWRPSFRRWLGSLAEVARTAPPAFRRFAGSAFVFRCGMAMGLPLFPLYWVREVQASDAWIGIITTANSGVLLVAYFIWSAATRRMGVGGVLLASSLGMALYPLATAGTQTVWLLAIFAGLAGFFAAGNDLVNFDLVLSTIPADHQASYVGFYQTLQNAALFIMPLVGTLIADAIGIGAALVVAGVLRLSGAGMYLALGIGRAPRPSEAPSR